MCKRGVLIATAFTFLFAANPARGEALGPSPSILLGSRVLLTPPIDAAEICLPSGTEDSLALRIREAASSSRTAREAADGWVVSESPPQRELISALLLARAATTSAELRAARTRLGRWRTVRAPVEARACAHLETARLELHMRRLPEASAQAELAGRLRTGVMRPTRVAEAADFYAAEARHLAGLHRQAAVVYRVLMGRARTSIADAARLRFADALFETGDLPGALLEYDTLLARASDFGATQAGWGLRAVEAARDARDTKAARRWLDRMLEEDLPQQTAALARLHLADLLVAEGDPEAARTTLEAVRDKNPGQPTGALAELRLLAWPNETAVGPKAEADAKANAEASAKGRDARLREIASRAPPALAAYARLHLGRALAARGEPLAAVNVLGEVARDISSNAFLSEVESALGDALAMLASEVTDAKSCTRFIDRIGWRRTALARHASRPEPFLALGLCYEDMGMSEIAIQVYRRIEARFGPDGAELVALPLARTSLLIGSVDEARRQAVPRSRVPGPQRANWQLLLAETEMLDGRYAPAAERLRPLVKRGEPHDQRARAIVALARAAARLPTLSRYGDVLADAIDAVDAKELSAHAEALGEAALIAGEAFRLADESEAALQLYDLATSLLPPGTRRAKAVYWVGTLRAAPRRANQPANPRASDNPPASNEGGGAWNHLVEGQAQLEELRERIDSALGSDRARR